MSTVTSSASPTASPCVAPYPQYRGSPRPTAAASKPPSATKPANAQSPSLTASAPSNASTLTTAAPRSPRPSTKHQYADAGTQYSPDGFPPTAAASSAVTATQSRPKRKQSTPSPVFQPTTSAMAAHTNGSTTEPPSTASVAMSITSDSDGNHTLETQRAIPGAEAQKKARTANRPVKIMPRKYETCDPKDLGVLIADMLMELIRLNDKIPLRDGKLTRFHSRAPPGISCHDYLNRLIQHATLAPPILLSMVYYIDKLCAMYPAFTIGSLTVHRFLITAATVAAKGLSDSFWTNATYARIGGISTSELATLELDFLQRVQYRIVPQPETLVDYYVSLVHRSPDYELEDEVVAAPEPMDEDPP